MKKSILSILLLLNITSCGENPNQELEQQLLIRSFENRAGTFFTPLPKNILKAPAVSQITLPEIDNIDAIWGATGRDDEGNIYIGLSSHGGDYGSSYLYQYNPVTQALSPQSDTVTQLKNNKIYREGMRQNKLHSKFYQADDGYIYFSSFDESGEAEGINPTWGGHLWRKTPNADNWEHILATEEALVGINTNGRLVYALGYWGHVLYQFNITTGESKRVVVGSTQQHVSRNFLVDELGHAYVPQVTINDFNEIMVMLAEYDENLTLVAQHAMPSYRSENMEQHHGIVAYTSMKNGDIYFTTADGGLYLIQPFGDSNKKVSYKGMMHPENGVSITSLFSVDGANVLVGIGRSKTNNNYDWVTYETSLNLANVIKMPIEQIKSPLIYGSLTRDNDGGFYAVGWQKKAQYTPLLMKISLN